MCVQQGNATLFAIGAWVAHCTSAMPTQMVVFWSRSRDNSLVFALNSIPGLFLIFLSGTAQVVLLYRDSLAELAESRSKSRARWTLQREFAAFMSHYKNGAPSSPP